MKIRTDYVSNSSSSSFIVIVSNGNDCTASIAEAMRGYAEEWTPYCFPNDAYKHDFGWEFENTSDFGGKMNFIGLQLLELFIMKCREATRPHTADGCKRQWRGKDFDRCYDMLKKVCKEQFGFNIKLNDDLIKTSIADGKDGYHLWQGLDSGYYIDHQSAVCEDSCMEMFDSEDALYNFLRFEESHIQGGNDNV